MAKFYGKIGFAETKETAPGVWTESITERAYPGDLLRSVRRLGGSGVNDGVDISNEISIVADPYARENFHAMRYVSFMGTRWKAGSVDIQYPRLIITLGGIYHGGAEDGTPGDP